VAVRPFLLSLLRIPENQLGLGAGVSSLLADRSNHNPLELDFMHNAAVVTLYARLVSEQILVEIEGCIQFLE
jgi:hypothetical protein